MAPEGKPERGRSPHALSDEPSETSGLTSALLLRFLDQEGGPDAVGAVLERCGLEECEAELRDENSWFSWETKIELFEAAATVLDRPHFMAQMAAFGLNANIAGGLKVALRTLGSPQFVLRNIVSANARFNRGHVLELLELEGRHALVRFSDISGRRRCHRLDCDYTGALLALIPELFGLPPAHVGHIQCAVDGADACVFELHWAEHAGIGRWTAVTAAATATGAGLSALLLPAALPVVAVAGAAGAGALLRHRTRWRQEQVHHLERQVQDSEEVAQRLFESLQDVVSDLRLEEVVAKVTRNAQIAVGGREFLLLVREGDRLACQSSSDLPDVVIASVEAWANTSPRLLEQSLVIDDVGRLPALTALAELDNPLCSLASAPLRFLGEAVGLLVALGGQQRTFLPRDVAVLESYAAQVAIALSNARLYQTERSLAARDPLSGLLNHRSFHESLDAELAHCVRDQFFSSIVLLDLDHFKRVNDEDGHAAGDRLLRATARAISDSCRREDLAFRIGGDEFALLLPRLTEVEALEVAHRVCASIAGLDDRIGASAGVVCAGPADHDKAALLARADARLYADKRGVERPAWERGVTTGRGIAPRLALDLLLGAMELHHGETVEHSTTVAALAESVAIRVGLGERERELILHAALVHDLGKLAVPRALLDKPGALSDEEWVIVREHPERGAEVLRRVGGLAPLAVVVRACHERWDGGGYPDGLREVEIPLAARIIAACDAFEAMTADRPYCAARPFDEALAELRMCAGTQFDPAVIKALLAELSAVHSA